MKKSRLKFRKIGFTAASFLGASTFAFSQTEQPNIVLFMVDDMGWQDTSEPFWTERTPYNDICHTPNMERLARQGVKFTQAYACAISSPTRTSLMTGMNAARHRVTNWTLNPGNPTDAGDNNLSFPNWNFNGLQPNSYSGLSNVLKATTLVELLKDNGYYTIHAGKAHWGAKTTDGENPLNLGFDVNIGGSAAGGPRHFDASHGFYGDSHYPVPGLDDYITSGTYLSEALTLEAIKKLNNRPTDKPFYLYMSHYAVHVPVEMDNRFKDRYQNKGLSNYDIAYLTMVEGMDKSLGDLMDWLEANGQAANTVVIFMSDNGGHHSMGNITVNGVKYDHNYPLRGSKGSYYEGGIREPMIVKWPGVTTADTQTEVPVIIEDFFPSILEMAGVKTYTTSQERDGVSFIPVLKGEKKSDNERELYWHFPNRWGERFDGGYETYSAIRKGDYKLIYRWHSSAFELYNLKDDIGEKNNLLNSNSEEYKEIAKNLAVRLSNYLRSVDAQRPTMKSTGKLVAYPDEVKLPTSPVAPKISDANNEYWFKIHDNRSPQNFWQVDGTGTLKLANEAIANDTTTADKLFKLQLAPDGTGYQIFSRTSLDIPITAANTTDGADLKINASNPINSWVFTPSTAVSGFYHIAAEADNQQLNSYADTRKKVSFWMPEGDTDPGNRWAFIPGFLRGALTEYPKMQRFFTNPTVPHEQAQSRFLTSVVLKVGSDEQVLIGPNAENPTDYSKITQANTNYPDAVVDAKIPQIVISDKATSFDLTCLGSTVNNRNLQYTQQNIFIDWNKDFDFLDANEAGERSSATAQNATLITAPGYTRTVTIPAGTAAGTYRMRLVYHEPEVAATEWKASIWSSNVIRNGIAYDFELKIESTTSVTSQKAFENKVRVSEGRIFVDGVSEFEIFTIDGKKLNPSTSLSKGVYIVRSKDFSTKVVVR